MDQDRIIPARFDHREAAAGLRSLEESGRTADDLTHAADSAVARFQRAHESIRTASRGFLDLHRAARAAGDPGADDSPEASGDRPAGRTDAAEPRTSGPHDVLTHRPILAGPRPENHDAPEPAASRRTAGPGMAVGQSTTPHLAVPAADANQTHQSTDGLAREIENGAHKYGTGAAPPADGRADVESRGVTHNIGRSLRVTTSSQGPRHPSGEMPPEVDSSGRLRDRGIGSMRDHESGNLGASPAPALHDPTSSSVRGLAPDLAGWKGGSERLAGSRPSSPEATRRAATDRRSQAVALEDESASGHGHPGVDIDAWEAIRRMRTAAPSSEPVAGRSSGEPAGWSRHSSSPSQGDRETSFSSRGGASGSVIERLLREQNELIRQDGQRAASPPISAPPPLRGGGIRMGS